MEELTFLQVVLGACLIVAGVLLFSLWKDRLSGFSSDEEKMKFLIFSIRGGGGLLAIFFACGGLYVLLEALLRS